jgi:hypothetical protein
MKHTTGPRRGRPRGNGKRFSQGGGGKNQTFESSGPEVKIRGTAQQVYEKYLSLARDAVSAGDRIAAEGYFQFADHYYRLVNAANGNGQSRGDQGNRIPPPPESAAGQFGGDEGDGAGTGAPVDMAGDDGDDEDGPSVRDRDDDQGESHRHQPQRPADEFRPMRPADPVQRRRFAEEVEEAAPATQAAELAEALARAKTEDPADSAPRAEPPAENGTGTGHRRGERTLGLGGRRTLNRRSQAAAETPAELPVSAEPETPAADVPSAESREGGLFGPKPIRRRVRRVAPRKEPADAN